MDDLKSCLMRCAGNPPMHVVALVLALAVTVVAARTW